MTYFIAASLPEGHPAKEEVVRILRKFKIRFDGSTNPERVKNFIDLQSVASSAAVTPRENAIGKATKPIRAVYRIGFPSTSAASASTSREVLERAPVEQMERFGQSPPMATDGNECFDQEDDDEDDPLQHILKVCNKRAEQIEQQRSLGKVMVAEERRLPMNGYAPAEVKQEEGIADVIEGETKPPVLNQEEIEREDEPLVVKEEEPEAEDDVMDVPPEEEAFAPALPSVAHPFPRPLKKFHMLGRPYNPKNRPHFCDICGTSFTSFGFLRRHQTSQHAEMATHLRPHVQSLNFRNSHQATWKRHSEPATSSEEPNYPCDRCDERYFSMVELTRHQRCSHVPSARVIDPTAILKQKTHPSQECWVCPKTLPATELMEHMFRHGGSFRCDLCPATFALERILVLHHNFYHVSTTKNPNLVRGLFF